MDVLTIHLFEIHKCIINAMKSCSEIRTTSKYQYVSTNILDNSSCYFKFHRGGPLKYYFDAHCSISLSLASEFLSLYHKRTCKLYLYHIFVLGVIKLG